MLLPIKTILTPLGESRSLVVRRSHALERWLRAETQLNEFELVMWKYFEMGHAQPVTISEFKRPCNEFYFLSMQAFTKESSATSEFNVVL